MTTHVRLGAALSAAVLASLVVAPLGGAQAAADPAARAEHALRALPSTVSLSALDSLVPRDTVVDPDGTTHVRFDRRTAGLPVIGGDLVVHQSRSGAVRGVSATTRAPLTVSTVPRVTAAAAGSTARAVATNGATRAHAPVLEIDARTAAPRLVWAVQVDGTQADGTPSELVVLLDAATGRVVDTHEQVETAGGSGLGYFNGAVPLETTVVSGGFSLKDPSRGNTSTTNMANKTNGNGSLFTDADNAWGTGSLSNTQTVAVDAQYGTAVTWDYYKNTHARTGIANNGVGAYNRVHYGRNYNNAFWSDSCFCMTYGDGDGTTYNPFDSLDVAGHEMSHGVTSRTANLTYSGESGGLNEATSDIFGTAVEFYAGNANDVPDYKIGEELYVSNPGGTKALRYMYNPALDTRSPNCWSSSLGSLDVHYSSGVANRFFFLLSEGSTTSAWGSQPATCNGAPAVTGIGRDAAARIWYRALTVYMTSSTNYAGARAATLSAASDLYGAGSAQTSAVAAAWTAVGRS